MTAPILFSSATDEWPTPRDFFAKLNRHYQFTLDPCATASIKGATGNITVYRKHNKPALGPVGDSLEDFK